MGCHIEFCLINTTEAFLCKNQSMSPKAAQHTNHANLNVCFLAKFYHFGYKDDASSVHSE